MDDAAAFAGMYRDLRRFAAAVAPPDVDPDDLVQEALARTLRRGPFSMLEDPASYLRTAILNLARNHHRDTARRTLLGRRVAEDTVTTDVYPSDFVDLSRLTVDQRAVLYLRHVDGLPVPAIAELLGISEQAVRARSSRAIKTLRIELREESPADENA